MKQTYSEAIEQVFKDEGGYSNDAGDPGGPTKYGITIEDARMYWKKDATAQDVRNMPKSVAEDIYIKHYATPIGYNDLPPGVDYAVLDYGINSGISRALRIYNKVKTNDPIHTINAIYDERLKFLQSRKTWPLFGKGWGRRCQTGRTLALQLNHKYSQTVPVEHKAAAGGLAVAVAAGWQWIQGHPYEVVGGAIAVGLLIYFLTKLIKGK